MRGRIVIFYSTPAFGHISAAFEIMRAYVERGYRVIFYSTETFREAVEKTGAEYRKYDFDESRLDLTVGNQILRLEDTILTFTDELTPGLLREATGIKPDMIFHDNVAMWGRVVAHTMQVPAVCINSFPTVPSFFSRGMLAYTKQFGGVLWKDFDVLPHMIKVLRNIRQKYPHVNTSMLANTLNREQVNIVTFPKHLQPGYRSMKKNYLFTGPTLTDPDKYYGEKADSCTVKRGCIFISLGTVFQNNIRLFSSILEQFRDSEFTLLISMTRENERKLRKKTDIPENVEIRQFVRQGEVLDKACLYIGAGGMNSVCQAIHRRVPCLLYPQQGEQRITSERIEGLGLGKIGTGPENIRRDAEALLCNYHPDERIYRFFKQPDYDRLIRRVDRMLKEERCKKYW